jgi:hypothetical protein
MSEAMQAYKTAGERMAEFLAARQAAAKTAFDEVSKSLFDEFPPLESFSWTQYAPYFNDGDECVFSANTDYPTVNGVEVYPHSKDIAPHERAVCDFLAAFADDDLKTLFGDHVEVTVTRDGATADEYNHG